MKLNQVITGCALAAGLMAFAASSQAAPSASSGNIVIDNTLYSPINVKATVKYLDGGKIKQATATSKDLLNDLGFDTAQVKLTLAENGDVYVVNKKNGSTYDVSGESEIGMWVNTSEQLYTEKYSGNNDQNYKYQSEGQVSFYFSGDTAYMSLTGLYSAKYNSSYNDNKGTLKKNTSAKTFNLAGYANVSDLGSNLPASANANGNGNGTVDVIY